MPYLIDRILNNMNRYRTALRFRQFSLKLLQIRIAERFAMLTTPGRFLKRPGLPKDIVIRVTERCFLKCKFCAQGGESGRVDRSSLKTGPVKPETFRKIMDETEKWPVKPFIKITGGEPLVMGAPFINILKEMRERGFVVKLNTNGLLLKSKKIARLVAETDLNYLSISIDGGRAVHNELRGNPKLFDSIMEGIDNVQQYRKELKKKNMMILISMMVSSETQDQIKEVFNIARQKKADWFNIQLLNYTTPERCGEADNYFKEKFGTEETPWRAFCNPRFNEIDAESVARQIRDILAERSSMPVSVMGGLTGEEDISRYYFTSDPIRKNLCVLPFTGMHIVPPGKAAFCIDYPFYEYGDIRDNSLEDAWYGERASAFREDMVRFYKDEDNNYPHCRRCNWRFN